MFIRYYLMKQKIMDNNQQASDHQEKLNGLKAKIADLKAKAVNAAGEEKMRYDQEIIKLEQDKKQILDMMDAYGKDAKNLRAKAEDALGGLNP